MARRNVELNRRNVAAMLKSSELQAGLLERAEKIATAAGPGMVASVAVGRVRARASVITDTDEAILAEAGTRELTRAIDAGRY